MRKTFPIYSTKIGSPEQTKVWILPKSNLVNQYIYWDYLQDYWWGVKGKGMTQRHMNYQCYPIMVTVHKSLEFTIPCTACRQLNNLENATFKWFGLFHFWTTLATFCFLQASSLVLHSYLQLASSKTDPQPSFLLTLGRRGWVNQSVSGASWIYFELVPFCLKVFSWEIKYISLQETATNSCLHMPGYGANPWIMADLNSPSTSNHQLPIINFL